MAGLDLGKITEEIAKYLAKGWTKERIRPYLPMLRDELKNVPLEEKITLAVTLREKFPDLADIINELVEVPPQSQQPPPPEPEPQDLTEDEEAQIAQYTDSRLKEGSSLRLVLPSVNATWGADLDVIDLQAILQRWRVNKYNAERRVAVEVATQRTADLQAALQHEQEAHLATKQSTAMKYLEYREGIVLRWGASLVAALGLGLGLGRLL